jgi:hypothetical protein
MGLARRDHGAGSYSITWVPPGIPQAQLPGSGGEDPRLRARMVAPDCAASMRGAHAERRALRTFYSQPSVMQPLRNGLPRRWCYEPLGERVGDDRAGLAPVDDQPLGP